MSAESVPARRNPAAKEWSDRGPAAASTGRLAYPALAARRRPARGPLRPAGSPAPAPGGFPGAVRGGGPSSARWTGDSQEPMIGTEQLKADIAYVRAAAERLETVHIRAHGLLWAAILLCGLAGGVPGGPAVDRPVLAPRVTGRFRSVRVAGRANRVGGADRPGEEHPSGSCVGSDLSRRVCLVARSSSRDNWRRRDARRSGCCSWR